MAMNKSQHYVPRFYLKLFSEDDKNIMIYNLDREKSFYALLKDQCATSYFYSKKIEIEKLLSVFEALASKIIQEIIANESIDNMDEREYASFVSFILTQYGKTKSTGDELVEQYNKAFDMIKPHIADTDGAKEKGLTLEDFKNVKISVKHPASETTFFYGLSSVLASDLAPILVINKSKRDLITSDHPVVFYNSFFNGKVDGGTTGLAQDGLQIFYPLSPKLMIILYDSRFYTLKTSQWSINVHKNKDIRRLNGLQILNCDRNIYYKGSKENKDINRHHLELKHKRIQDKSEVKVVATKEEGETKKELIRSSRVSFSYNIETSFLKNKDITIEGIGIRNPKLAEMNRKIVDAVFEKKITNLSDFEQIKKVLEET